MKVDSGCMYVIGLSLQVLDDLSLNMTKSSEYRDPPTSRKALANFIAGAIGMDCVRSWLLS